MKIVGLTTILVALTAPAFGHWMLSDRRSAFDGVPITASPTDGRAFGLSLECGDENVPLARFSTPERVALARTEISNSTALSLVVQVDENRHWVLSGHTERSPEGKLSVTGEMPRDLLAQMATADHSVTSGLKILGAVYYTTAFSVESARLASRALARGCSGIS